MSRLNWSGCGKKKCGLHAESAGNGVVGWPNSGFDIEGEGHIGGILGGLGRSVRVPIGEQWRRRLQIVVTGSREPTLHFSLHPNKHRFRKWEKCERWSKSNLFRVWLKERRENWIGDSVRGIFWNNCCCMLLLSGRFRNSSVLLAGAVHLMRMTMNFFYFLFFKKIISIFVEQILFILEKKN